MEEKEQNPIISYDTEITEEKYIDICSVLLRKQRLLPIIWIVCGALILLFVSFTVFLNSLEAGCLSISYLDLFFLVFSVCFLILGLRRLALKNKTSKKAYETYLSINGGTHQHIDFYEDYYVGSNKMQTGTYFYKDVASWEETNSAFLLYYGNRYSRLAFLIFKDGFATSEDLHKFIKLTEKVLAGKPYKRVKAD